ncbi:uncharacterized protein LOC100740779 [Bombus impatiens]|uniref:Uncharacterized protein LOC100740779 n=1 Tax=Bombus impatiens TaxID=132113 RepID=A0A6P6FDN8_BOMIM|nr:uncharacterized protein LOC100740779 [Bombus impatiens]
MKNVQLCDQASWHVLPRSLFIDKTEPVRIEQFFFLRISQFSTPFIGLFENGTILNVIHSNFESYLECLFLSASLLFIVIFTKFSRKSKMK